MSVASRNFITGVGVCFGLLCATPVAAQGQDEVVQKRPSRAAFTPFFMLGVSYSDAYGDAASETSEFDSSLSAGIEFGMTFLRHVSVGLYGAYGIGGLDSEAYGKRFDSDQGAGAESESETVPSTISYGLRARWTPFRVGVFAPFVGAGVGGRHLSLQQETTVDETCEDDPATTVDECDPEILDSVSYNGFVGGPVFGVLLGDVGDGFGLGQASDAPNFAGFIQVAIDYGIAWSGPTTLDKTRARNLGGKLNMFEVSVGAIGF